jgi:hypothetical protein
MLDMMIANSYDTQKHLFFFDLNQNGLIYGSAEQA